VNTTDRHRQTHSLSAQAHTLSLSFSHPHSHLKMRLWFGTGIIRVVLRATAIRIRQATHGVPRIQPRWACRSSHRVRGHSVGVGCSVGSRHTPPCNIMGSTSSTQRTQKDYETLSGFNKHRICSEIIPIKMSDEESVTFGEFPGMERQSVAEQLEQVSLLVHAVNPSPLVCGCVCVCVCGVVWFGKGSVVFRFHSLLSLAIPPLPHTHVRHLCHSHRLPCDTVVQSCAIPLLPAHTTVVTLVG
jgi:hypothetical protein